MSEIHLSVVIPAYNEEVRLKESLREVLRYLKSQPYTFEVILVDDGSSDRTKEVAETCLKDVHHQVLVNQPNQGKGYSVKRGMLAARGRFILFSDADFSTPLEEVERFLQYLQSGYDVVIGSRALPESRVEIRQNILRQNMGKIFNLFVRLFASQEIHDSQCGFKCFKSDAAKNLFGRQMLKGFSFDVEILYLAQRLGCRVLEEPVIWRNSPHSRVHIVKDSLRMLFDIMRIRWIHRRLK